MYAADSQRKGPSRQVISIGQRPAQHAETNGRPGSGPLMDGRGILCASAPGSTRTCIRKAGGLGFETRDSNVQDRWVLFVMGGQGYEQQ